MLLSIIIPVYNSEKYLKVCLDSVKNIDLEEYELIIIDDGSSDSSRELINNFNPPKKIKCHKIFQDNNGASVARNRCLEVATGDYILFLDSDDYLDAENLSQLVATANEKKLDLVTTPYYVFDSQSSYLKKRQLNENIVTTGWDFVKVALKLESYRTELCINIYRRQILKKNGINFVPGICYEDALFLTQFLFYSKRAAFLNKPFYHYRQHDHSITAARNSVYAKYSEIKVVELLLMFFRDNKIKDKWWNDIIVSRYYRLVRFRYAKSGELTRKVLFLRPLTLKSWLKKIAILIFIFNASEI
jgi:glycosyltransferase involved in cell wall biosynthesis